MITGALLTGVIGFFVVVACTATLHPAGIGIGIDDGVLGVRGRGPLRGPRPAPFGGPLFYGSFLASMAIAAVVVLVPAVPLVPVLYLTQVLNAVLLLVILPFMVRLARDPEVLGDLRLGRMGTLACVGLVGAVAAACVALLALGLIGG